MRCAEIREMLPAHVRDGDASLAVRRHLSRCRECRAELTRYEALLGSLATLESHPLDPPPGLVTALAEIPQASRRLDVLNHVARNRGAYLGGAAVALAGAAGAAVWRARRQRVVTA